MTFVPIDRVDDPRIAAYSRVADGGRLREAGLFVAEGRLVVRTLLESRRFAAESLLLTPAALAAFEDVLASHDAVTVYVAPPDVLAAVVGFNVHRGCLAIGRRPRAEALSALLAGAGEPSRIVVAERMANVDNMGALFRNARAFGAAAVLLSPGCCDPLYRKAVRVSIGACLHVPFAEVDPWPEGLGAVKAAGFEVVALTPHGRTDELLDGASSLPPRVALLVGHEGDGLSNEALAAADRRVRIDMPEPVDSVNVGTASGIALYVCARAAGRAAGRDGDAGETP